MKGIGKVCEGDIVVIDFLVDGISVSLNGEGCGKVVGLVIVWVLFKVWFGEKLVDVLLKKVLFGI